MDVYDYEHYGVSFLFKLTFASHNNCQKGATVRQRSSYFLVKMVVFRDNRQKVASTRENGIYPDRQLQNSIPDRRLPFLGKSHS